jgi:hypothetical protein
MPLVTQHSRQLLKRSIISGATPSVFTGSTNHTDGTWGINDIYAGEMFWNMDNKKLWLGWENSSGNTGVDLIYPQNSSTGSCQTDFYTNNIFPCDINLPVNMQSNLNNVLCQSIVDANSGSNEFSIIDSNTNFSSRIQLQSTPSIGLDIDDTNHKPHIDISSGSIFIEHYDVAGTYRNYLELINSTGNGIKLLSEDSPNSTQCEINLTSTAALPQISLRTIGLVNNSDINIEENRIIYSSNNHNFNPTLQAFADDTAAGVGGLLIGDLYQTDGTGAAPLNVAGIVMIKQ